ncbi:MAG: PLC-like phosphodiesterase, partial [Olpidium bornovanus]
MRVVVAFLVALAASGAGAAAAAGPSACNGFAELCPMPYSSVATATTHNAYAVGPYPAANQNNPVARQLEDGIRGLSLDIMYPSATNQSAIYLCHTDCSLLSAGSLVDTLKVIAYFLHANPNEVVTIFFENDNIPPDKIREPFVDAGLDSLAFVPSSQTAWPTLGEMI